MNRPTLPTEHSLSPYATYMLDRMDTVEEVVNTLLVVTGVLLFFTIVGGAAFAFFGYQKWRERQDLIAWRVEVRNLLAVIKGWSVVNKSTSDRAVFEVKEDIAKIPEAAGEIAATKVVEKLEEIKLSDSVQGMQSPPRGPNIPPRE